MKYNEKSTTIFLIFLEKYDISNRCLKKVKRNENMCPNAHALAAEWFSLSDP
jgi:hypothetical protein